MAKKTSKVRDARPAMPLDIVAPVRYRVDPVDPKAHYFEVTCTIDAPDPSGQRVSLPAWIPGSYMIREFARHIVAIAATASTGTRRRSVPLAKLDKHTWQAAPCDGPLVIAYRVYAWDPSVRAAHLDEGHAFFNGTSLFLRVRGQEEAPHDVELVAPHGVDAGSWRVATTLPEHGAARLGFGRYRARDYDELVDHPVEMGTFRLERFVAAGVPHEIAFTGAAPRLDATRVVEDLSILCAAQIAFFDESSDGKRRRARRSAPFDRYVFLTNVTTDGYGGLEHRASTALVCARDALPVIGASERSSGYRTFLGLASHEYFHSWNVKRIKPAAFAPYDLDRENHTSLLWVFEGFTSYYDDLFLVRTGLFTVEQYLEAVGATVDHVRSTAGHAKQSVADSSFDAWTKYYRPDENTPNAVASYYRKGSLVGLCLDLFLRATSRGKASLDDVMRLLWNRYGATFYEGGTDGLAEDAFPDLVREATGIDADDEILAWAYGTAPLPLEALLAHAGLVLVDKPIQGNASLDAKVTGGDAECRIAQVREGGAAHEAGLAAGDLLVALDGLRVTAAKLDAMLGRYRAGDTLDVVSFRGDVLQERRIVLAPPPPRASIVAAKKAGKASSAFRAAWLGRAAR